MNDTVLRLTIFFAVLCVLLGLEFMQHGPRPIHRGLSNFALLILGTVLLRLAPLMSVVFAAEWAASRNIGLWHHVAAAPWLVFVLSLLVMDVAIYWQHRFFHRLAPLWAIHRVHHSDNEVDVSTGLRFHPLELLLSQLWKLAVVLAFGIAVEHVLIFELALSTASLFIHAKLRLPSALERVLRIVIVTPAMHRVHHNREQPDTDRNFGSVLSCWDRIFASYRPPKEAEHFVVGLDELQPECDLSLWQLLVFPFKHRQP